MVAIAFDPVPRTDVRHRKIVWQSHNIAVSQIDSIPVPSVTSADKECFTIIEINNVVLACH